MALFIDRSGTFDVEIVDDTMFVYGARFDLLDPRTYAGCRSSSTPSSPEPCAGRSATATTSPCWRRIHAVSPSQPPSAPLFTVGGDGPAQTASNSIAARGRRLRRRRWGLWSVVGVLVIGFVVYNEFIAPIFGLPTLGR